MAQNNFPATLPPLDSDLAVQVFKDPYLFDFLGTDAPRREAELQRGLMTHLQKFLLELGQGFAFVGQQVHLELGNQDYYLDLLFYHLKLRCYVAIELKARPFEPGDGAQLGVYMHAVDKLLTHPDDKPTIGLLLVRTKNRVLVEYALAGSRQPISVSQWETQLTQQLPEDMRGSLPSIEEIEAEMAEDLGAISDPEMEEWPWVPAESGVPATAEGRVGSARGSHIPTARKGLGTPLLPDYEWVP